MALASMLRRALLLSVLALPLLAAERTRMPPMEIMVPLKKLYAAELVEARIRSIWDRATINVRTMYPGVIDDDVSDVRAAFDRYDFESDFLNRWGALFTVEEWQTLDTYLDAVGLKQVAELRSAIDDAIELNKGQEFIQLRGQTFAEGLTPAEVAKIQAFLASPLAARFWRMVDRMERDVPEVVGKKAAEAIAEVGERVRQRAERETETMEEAAAAATRTDAEGELVYAVADVDQPPLLRAHGEVKYPAELAGLKLKAQATVVFIVNRQGKTEGAKVVKTTDHRFDQACLAAISSYEYRPAKRFKEKVSCRMYQTLQIYPPDE